MGSCAGCQVLGSVLFGLVTSRASVGRMFGGQDHGSHGMFDDQAAKTKAFAPDGLECLAAALGHLEYRLQMSDGSTMFNMCFNDSKGA